MKKFWSVASKVLVWLIVILTMCMMVFTIVSVNTVGRNDRDIFGYKAYIVLSDSMSKTDFDAGDLVLVKEVDPTTLKEGDIISFISENSTNKGQIVTHKIRSKATDAYGNPGFITYGTSTNMDDDIVVSYAHIQGKYCFALPNMGTFFNFLRTTPGYILCILLPFLLLIGYQAVICVRLFRRYKAQQLEEIRLEKEALQQERKKSEEMLEEIKRLKAQLDGATVEQKPVAEPHAELEAVQTPSVAEAEQPEESDELSLDSIMEEFSGSSEQEG